MARKKSFRDQFLTRSSRIVHDAETRNLRYWLRLYLLPAFTWDHRSCICNLIYCCLLVIQTLKVIFVTSMILRFASHREEFTTVVNRGHLTLRHQLLKTWDTGREIPPYPPGYGSFALYSTEALHAQVIFTIERFYNIEDDLIGLFRLPRDTDNQPLPITVCIQYHGDFYRNNDTTLGINDICFKTRALEGGNGTRYRYILNRDLHRKNASYMFRNMIKISISFRLHSVRLLTSRDEARCLHVDCQVEYVDTSANGQVLIDMTTTTAQIPCMDMNIRVKDAHFGQFSLSLSALALAFTILSFITTIVSAVAGAGLFVWTYRYSRKIRLICDEQHDYLLSSVPLSDYLKFFSMWDVVVLVGDVCTFIGTLALEFTSENIWTIAYLDKYTTVLGAGCILSWGVLLRYFKFHTKFNLLFATLSHALWDVSAYLVCVTILFFGYVLVGYVVLGPYHIKFATPSLARETLLAIVNGDEIFATVVNLEVWKTVGPAVPTFRTVYLSSYVIIFTVIVLNVLVAIFMSAYERIQARHAAKTALLESRERSPLQEALIAVLDATSRDPAVQARRDVVEEISTGTGGLSREEHRLSEEVRKFLTNPDPQDVLHRTPLKRFIHESDELSDEITSSFFLHDVCSCLAAKGHTKQEDKQETITMNNVGNNKD